MMVSSLKNVTTKLLAVVIVLTPLAACESSDVSSSSPNETRNETATFDIAKVKYQRAKSKAKIAFRIANPERVFTNHRSIMHSVTTIHYKFGDGLSQLATELFGRFSSTSMNIGSMRTPTTSSSLSVT